MMASSHYSRILLAERPTDNLTPTTFRREVLPLDLKPSGSQVLVQVLYVSIDPAMRGFLQERRGYMAAVQIGEVMRAYGLGIVTTAGDDSKFSQGDLVSGGFCESCSNVPSLAFLILSEKGWTEYIVMDDKDVTKIECVLVSAASWMSFIHSILQNSRRWRASRFLGAFGSHRYKLSYLPIDLPLTAERKATPPLLYVWRLYLFLTHSTNFHHRDY